MAITSELAIAALLVIGTAVRANDDCDTTVSPGESMQDSIDAAADGDTICFEPGTYNVALSINYVGLDVNKLSLVSTEPHRAVLNGPDTAGVRTINVTGAGQAISLTIDGFKFTGTGTTANSIAINVQAASSSAPQADVQLLNNRFEGAGQLAMNSDSIHLQGSISGNEFTGRKGLSLRVGDMQVLVNSFTVANEAIEIFRDVPGYGGPRTLSISGNETTNNAFGVRILHADANLNGIAINANCFEGNNVAVQNHPSNDQTLDATGNWWGDASGPTHVDNEDGTGDPVVGTVDFSDWLDSCPADEEPPPPTDPATADDCKNNGWVAFGFSNQGQCIRFVNTGQDSR